MRIEVMKRLKSNFKKFTTPVTVAVVGAGAVGKEMIRILEQRKFPMKELRVLARTARTLEVDGKQYPVQETTAQAFDGVQIALFAGTEGEKGAAVTFGKEAVARGAVVIDNGADFRMDPKVPLVIPEINAQDLAWHQGIVANPNCTTAVMLMAVAPIYKKFGVKRIVVSTYQAVSGAGGKAITDLRTQTEEYMRNGKVQDPGSFPDPIAFNVLAHNWKIEQDGYSNEELKAIRETKKILGDNSVQVIPTTARVPVFNAHSESIYVETKKPVSVKQVVQVLKKAPGVLVVDEQNLFNGKWCPMPTMASGKDEVLVGRIRKDLYHSKGILLWAVGDNLRKGAALNAVQIAECLVR
jgi:aspartate-semialdehyde dehydrogenase